MQNRLVQIALSLALLGLLIQIVLIAPSQIRDAETKAAVLPTPDLTGANDSKELAKDSNVDQSLKGMHMIETQEGRKEWELWSDKATSLKSQELLQLETVKAIFFSDSGVTFTVTGKQGLVQTKSKNLRVEGDVVTRSSNGYTFRSEVMEYASAGRSLSAPGHVEMFGPRDSEGHSLHLTGVGMKASLELSNMEILSEVKAEKGLDKGRKALITSHRSIFSGKDKTAKFLDDVVLDLDNMRITGPEARFDYDAKSDMVKSVYVSGGTRVSDADKWATAQNVNIDFKSNKFIFRGSPRVVQNNDELRGEEIVFLDNGKQVLVQKARAKVDERRLEKKK
ncbi:MAG: LPS export ABC transporter periplasmic protein LptC [Bdellovibrionales bacterium]